MYLIFGQCDENTHAAARLYAERFPQRRHPLPNVFRRLDHRVTESGSFVPTGFVDRGRPRTMRTPDAENAVLARVEEAPSSSVRSIALELGLEPRLVWDVIHEEGFHPYHYTKVQSLQQEDFMARLGYCNWLVNKVEENPAFSSKVIWTDEANFSRNGLFNQRNEHFYALENPNLVYPRNNQQRFSVNVWAGILGTNLLGPVFLPHRLNGENFLNFLEVTFVDLVDDVPLAASNNAWIQMDGAPAHNTNAVHNWCNINYPGRCIGRNGNVAWPPRSPDLTPLDFFLWGFVKNHVYQTPVIDRNDLVHRIENAFQLVTRNMLEHVNQNIVKRARACVAAGGNNFEHFL